jgi:hypothetical protein
VDTPQSFGRVSTRPLVLIVALLCALAIGLVGVNTLGTNAAPTTRKTVTFYQDRPGPDSPSRLRQDVPDPWMGHGH